MAKNPVGWFEIYVQDLNRATKFYEAVFQLKLETMEQMGPEMRFFPMVREGAGAPGALVKMEGVKSGGNSTLVYFVCEDCAIEQGRAVSAGGSVQRPKFAIGPYGFIALVIDTEGNMFGLHSTK